MRLYITGLLLVVIGTHGKIYERCELARELVEVHEIPRQQVATWVCIAEHESQYNTSAIGETNGDNSKDHGIFQISDLFWCSPPGRGWACGVTCAELEDDNIEDDVICAKRIYREHKKLSGDGFNAWVVYKLFCTGRFVDTFVEGCFDQVNSTEVASTIAFSTVGPTTIESKLVSALKPLSSDLSENKLSTETPKPRFHWFSRFGWT